MQPWWRRIRGVVRTGFTWAVAWSFVGTLPRLLFGFDTYAPLPLIFGVLGFFAGATFSVLVVLTQRRRSLDQISLPRFAAWGAVGGLLLSAVFAKAASLEWGDILVIAPTFAVASAVCASGSLAIARRSLEREVPSRR